MASSQPRQLPGYTSSGLGSRTRACCSRRRSWSAGWRSRCSLFSTSCSNETLRFPGPRFFKWRLCWRSADGRQPGSVLRARALMHCWSFVILCQTVSRCGSRSPKRWIGEATSGTMQARSWLLFGGKYGAFAKAFIKSSRARSRVTRNI